MFSLSPKNAPKKLRIIEMLEKLKAEKHLKLINDAKNQKDCIFKIKGRKCINNSRQENINW